MIVLASTADSACGETRPVTIVVTVSASDGTPLSGLGVEAALDGREHYAETSATGVAQFTLDLERVRKLLRLRVCAASHSSIPTAAGRARYDEVFSTHAPVAPEYVVVSEGVDFYVRTIQLPPAVKVTGRIVRKDDGKADQMLTLVNEQSGPMPISIRANKLTGAFEFPNAWKGAKSELKIAPLPGGVVMVLELSDKQTQSDVTLGDIVVDTRAQGEPVQLTFTNMDSWPDSKAADGLPPDISILSEAGIVLRELVIRDSGTVSARNGSPLVCPLGRISYFQAHHQSTGHIEPSDRSDDRVVRQLWPPLAFRALLSSQARTK